MSAEGTCDLDQPVKCQTINTVFLVCWLAAGGVCVRAQNESDFSRHIQPILHQHCTKCHGGVRRAGGLSLASAGKPATGDSGEPLLVAGQPDASELFRRVTTTDPDERMPAEGKPLDESEIALLRRWIEQGAAWPAHWSLKPIETRSPPNPRNSSWARSPIDAFVLGRLEASSVHPSPAADRYTLIRRLSLDLLGLPPTPAEADAFAAATAPDAYERLIDRLLASPHFGERFGRHWLDQARYADSDGYEVDKPRPTAFAWRDWVIAAVNSDLPLDQFTAQQFAGDLLADATPQQRLATAYHRQTLTNNEGGVDKEEYRFKAVLDRVSNTGTVWLGLTLGCAHCHDHPYDPITQRDVYALAAIFDQADETEIEWPELSVPRARNKKVAILSEREAPRTTRLLIRGDWLNPGEEIAASLPQSLHSRLNSNSINRLDLARWLVASDNPLTPRVLSNQIWLRLFGQGLVRTPEDFGARGEVPTHPKLLDWLACELQTLGWSRKALIRRIVCSATYRQSSVHRTELATLDPQNRLLARQNRLRAEAEIVRDLHYASCGLLTSKIGGPSVFPPLSAEFVKITFRSELPWNASTGADRYRRGMYTFFKRSVPFPDLMLFDCPDASMGTVQRGTSNTPLQALALLNSETAVEAARELARRAVLKGFASDEATIGSLFRACLARPPTAAEVTRLAALLQTSRGWYELHPAEAETLIGAFGDNATVVESAAVTATASAIMNLDEFITRE